MGYTVTSINRVPNDYSYYFVLISPETFSGASAIFRDQFELISALINNDSAFVKPLRNPDFLSSIIQLFSTHIDDPNTFETWNKIFDSSPGLIIMKPHPLYFNFRDVNHIFMFFTMDAINKAYLNPNELIKDIIDLSESRNERLIKKIINANQEDKSSYGFLQRLKNSLLLQPNFYGLGFDIKQFLNIQRVKRIYDLKHQFEN